VPRPTACAAGHWAAASSRAGTRGPPGWYGWAPSSLRERSNSSSSSSSGGGGEARAGGSAPAAAAALAPQPREPQDLGTHSFRMAVSYDGTAYSGWQLQPSAPTIQLHIERALGTALQEPREALGVSSAGRTDAGVHAAGQVVQFRTAAPGRVDVGKLPSKLNSLLPHDIRVSWMAATAPDFHVTCSAAGKVGGAARREGRAGGWRAG
jgi:hypothetical protein